MGINALTDVRFLLTQESYASLREYLLNCHRAEWALHEAIAGFRYTAQLRLAASVAAVALRYVDNLPRKVRSGALLESGLPEHAVDAALQDVEPGSDLFSERQPFMQRPAKTPKGPKDNARALGPQQHPVKKLSPSMPPDEAETYWNLGVGALSSLPLETAVLELVTYHHMSMAGNNSYDGDKCQMGSPAMRYVGADYTATEVFIRGESDLATLLRLIPKQWVEGTGLPAWADRTCEQSLVDEGEMQIAHPLWSATWSSNAPACYWEGEELHGVRTGGIPEEWYRKSEMGTTKETRKQWWDTRNQDDPFYLYMSDEQGQLKVQRLDFGRDGTELAVEWAAEGKTGALLEPRLPRVLDRAPDEVPVVFVRHYIAGTASSPNIRASEIFETNQNLWAFAIDPWLRRDVQTQAKYIQQLNAAVRSPFGRKPNSTAASVYLDDLADRRGDIEQAFWRKIRAVYVDILQEIRQNYQGSDQNHQGSDDQPSPFVLPDNLTERCVHAGLEAFDEVVNPHSLQEPARIAFVRSNLQRRLWGISNKHRNTAQEKS